MAAKKPMPWSKDKDKDSDDKKKPAKKAAGKKK